MKTKQQRKDEVTKAYEEFNLERAHIKKGNQELIDYWKSTPWWKFWLKPSFEEQRSIIISNWSSLNKKE